MRLRVACSVLIFACGTTSGNDGGVDSGSDVVMVPDISPGCGNFITVGYDVDASVCAPQLSSATSCNGSVCSYNVEMPCFGEAGAPDGGNVDCVPWCNDAAPPGAQPVSFCQPITEDGGAILAHCGGCGI